MIALGKPEIARPGAPAGPRGDRPRLVVMAKAPVPGRCMTRLAARVGRLRATALYRALLENAVAELTRAADAPVILCCAPSPRDAFFLRLARRYRLRLRRQASGGLGARMQQALASNLDTYAGTILFGVDQPDIDHNVLDHASQTLAAGPDRLWLAPTRDGGYWAIGVRRADARLFAGGSWSTNRVRRQTLRAAGRAGFAAREWRLQRDVDTGRDWHRLEPGLRATLARRAVMPGWPAWGRRRDQPR